MTCFLWFCTGVAVGVVFAFFALACFVSDMSGEKPGE